MIFKKYDSHLTKEELWKFDFKINVIPQWLEKYTRFNMNNKLIFLESFQFQSFLLDSLVENLNKYDSKYLSQ